MSISAGEEQRQRDGGRHARRGPVLADHAQNQREDGPADEVVEDRGADHDHAEIGAVEIEIHQRLGDDRQRRDGHRRRQEEREDHGVGVGLAAERAAAPATPPASPMAKGMSVPRTPTFSAVRPCCQTIERSTSSPATSRNSTIASEPMASSTIALLPVSGKSHACHSGASEPKTVGPQQHAGEQFAQHGRLVKSLRDFAEESRGADEHPERQQHHGKFVGVEMLQSGASWGV